MSKCQIVNIDGINLKFQQGKDARPLTKEDTEKLKGVAAYIKLLSAEKNKTGIAENAEGQK